MKCPIDGAQLVMTERSGVEIDYCPTCRGIWLDRGELDKIIERSGNAAEPTRRPDRDDPRHSDERGQQPRRRESFLSDLFDF